jgi:primosomal protein N' (replication factor Y)
LAVFHSGLTDRERLTAWLAARDGRVPIVIGTRSAVWTPLADLGVVIVDEEHDISYKQQDGFRYCARDVAIVRARSAGCPALLGTATPSLESWFNVGLNRYRRLLLPRRAGGASSPHIEILDVRGKPMRGGLSGQLLGKIAAHLQDGHQVLLFLNRRGYAPVVLCHHCGWLESCQRCDANMTYHRSIDRLRCHHCSAERSLAPHCPFCGSRQLVKLGLGTERVVEILKDEFPDANIVRIDRDTTRHKGSMSTLLERIDSGQADILVGTQMLCKGHHFPKVTLVGVIDADSRLHGVDFRSGERLAQLVIQVAGRAGRSEDVGTVVLQTYHPKHPLLVSLVERGYQAFSKSALAERCAASLPPYSCLALMRAEAVSQEKPSRFLEQARAKALALGYQRVQIFGPVPAPMERRAGRFRSHLLLQSRDRRSLHQVLDAWLPRVEGLRMAGAVRWSVDVDPWELL